MLVIMYCTTLYAENQQIYFSYRPGLLNGTNKLSTDFTTRIKNCIAEIRSWMKTNMLKFNGNKMEFIIFDMRQQLSKISNITIGIGNKSVIPVEYIRNLGLHNGSSPQEQSSHQQIHINLVIPAEKCVPDLCKAKT